MDINQNDLAYMAGIMDGEGTFSIVIRRRDKYHWYQDCIRVHMGEPSIPRWLHNKFGGSYNERKERGSNAYIWQSYGIEMRKICKNILPFLIQKKRQAEIMLELAEIKNIGKKYQRDPENIKNKKYELYTELRRTHQRNYLVRGT